MFLYFVLLILLLIMPAMISKILLDGVKQQQELWLLFYASITLALIILFITLARIGQRTSSYEVSWLYCMLSSLLLPWSIYGYKKSLVHQKHLLGYKCCYYVIFIGFNLSLWTLLIMM